MLGKKMSGGGSSKGRSNLPSSGIARTTNKGSGASSSTAAAAASAAGTLADSTDGQVYIPHIKATENAKLLPRYSAALGRPHDDSMPAEDLDAIQLELEVLLSTVALRARALKMEFDSLDRAEDKREKKGKYIEKPPASPGKRKRDDKKIKDATTKYFGKVAKLKQSSSAHSPVPSHHTDDSLDAVPTPAYIQSSHALRDNPKVTMPKNDTPNKFWLSVEPYCMPITQEDIKLLDDLIEEYSGPLVPQIPDLGPHYSIQWAAEDLKDEQDISNPNTKANKRFTTANNADVINMLKKSEKLMGENVTGPLTQRLMAAFLEDNVLPLDSVNVDADGNTAGANIETSAGSRTMSMLKNGISLERRVKKELIEQGLMDPDDFGKDNDDEILAEIMRVRTELTAIAEHNYGELQKLHKASKEEMKRLEIKRKLDAVDQEIIEIHKKVVAIKQKRKCLTEQERAEVFRLTEEQKRLSDLLDSMPAPGPTYSGV